MGDMSGYVRWSGDRKLDRASSGFLCSLGSFLIGRRAVAKFVRPEPVYERHVEQKWLVGTLVRLTKSREPALRDVPASRLTATGIISKVYVRFSRTPAMRHVAYEVSLDSEILSSALWNVIPGYDSFRVELL